MNPSDGGASPYDRPDGGSSPDIRGAGWQPPGLAGGDDARAAAVPAGSPQSQLPQAQARPGTIVGVAREVRQRQEQRAWGQSGQSTEQVWTFRVDRHDAQGAALPPVPVEMRGTSFRGSVDNGDWVEVPGTWRRGDTLHPRQVRNLTTGAEVGVRGWGLSRGVAIALAVVVVVVLVVVLFVAANALFFSHSLTPTPIRVPR